MKEQLIREEIDSLTSQIFSLWDTEGDGIVFSDDILAASGVEEVEFGLALARILGPFSLLLASLLPLLISCRQEMIILVRSIETISGTSFGSFSMEGSKRKSPSLSNL
jgi:hypothetical protein